MRAEVTTPADFVTEVLEDLVGRRVTFSPTLSFMTATIQARVPMATMVDMPPACARGALARTRDLRSSSTATSRVKR